MARVEAGCSRPTHAAHELGRADRRPVGRRSRRDGLGPGGTHAGDAPPDDPRRRGRAMAGRGASGPGGTRRSTRPRPAADPASRRRAGREEGKRAPSDSVRRWAIVAAGRAGATCRGRRDAGQSCAGHAPAPGGRPRGRRRWRAGRPPGSNDHRGPVARRGRSRPGLSPSRAGRREAARSPASAGGARDRPHAADVGPVRPSIGVAPRGPDAGRACGLLAGRTVARRHPSGRGGAVDRSRRPRDRSPRHRRPRAVRLGSRLVPSCPPGGISHGD